MTANSRRVVITGVGIVSPLGLDAETFWLSLAEGRSGIRPIQAFDTSALPVHIAGEVPDFNAKKVLAKEHRKSLRMMARTIELAVAAAQLALDDGRIDKAKLDPARFGVEFGSGLIATELPELADAAEVSGDFEAGRVDLEKWGREGLERIQPLWMLKYLPNMLACHVSILHNAQGPNNSITESDVASLLALGEAYHILLRDGADFFLVGGAESKLNPLSLVRQCLFETLSHRNAEPERACRPFDRGRDGLVLGEGSCVFCVEDLGHARQRGARIYAEVVGFGAAFDAGKDGGGIARAIAAALADAGINPTNVDHVNAHGLSTQPADVWEARGLQRAFGDLPSAPVFAPKSYFGNLGAGASVMELAASVLGLSHGLTPGTLNYEEPDPECPVTVPTDTRPVTLPYVLKVSFTPMGQCAALVLRRWDTAEE